jgi:hypothetical protein
MGIFELYLHFAITTGLCGIYELALPVLSNEKLDWSIRPPKFLFLSVFFILFLLAAPLVVLSCIIPSWGVQFRITLLETLLEEV